MTEQSKTLAEIKALRNEINHLKKALKGSKDASEISIDASGVPDALQKALDTHMETISTMVRHQLEGRDQWKSWLDSLIEEQQKLVADAAEAGSLCAPNYFTNFQRQIRHAQRIYNHYYKDSKRSTEIAALLIRLAETLKLNDGYDHTDLNPLYRDLIKTYDKAFKAWYKAITVGD